MRSIDQGATKRLPGLARQPLLIIIIVIGATTLSSRDRQRRRVSPSS
jgi:hypothetical protein